jgi:Putative adhesin
MTTWEFPCPQPARISVSNWASGSVAVSGAETDTIIVEVTASQPDANVDDVIGEVHVGFEAGKLAVAGPRLLGGVRRRKSLDLTITAPAGSDLDARTASADVACVGRLGELTVHTASGDVTAASATGPARVETASGDVFVDNGADVAVTTASGDIRVTRAAGEVRIGTASGDAAVSSCGGPVSVRTVSGDADLRELTAGHADVSTVSGDITITVTPGIGVYLDLASTTGNVRSNLDPADGDSAGAVPDAALEIKCRTISGDVRISKGRPSAVNSH